MKFSQIEAEFFAVGGPRKSALGRNRAIRGHVRGLAAAAAAADANGEEFALRAEDYAAAEKAREVLDRWLDVPPPVVTAGGSADADLAAVAAAASALRRGTATARRGGGRGDGR